MEVGKRGKVHVEDIVFLIRKDPKKYARVKVRNWKCIYVNPDLLHLLSVRDRSCESEKQRRICEHLWILQALFLNGIAEHNIAH